MADRRLSAAAGSAPVVLGLPRRLAGTRRWLIRIILRHRSIPQEDCGNKGIWHCNSTHGTAPDVSAQWPLLVFQNALACALPILRWFDNDCAMCRAPGARLAGASSSQELRIPFLRSSGLGGLSIIPARNEQPRDAGK